MLRKFGILLQVQEVVVDATSFVPHGGTLTTAFEMRKPWWFHQQSSTYVYVLQVMRHNNTYQ